jgi:response regulator RpfG family c-di-GMP phosphodiesterase
MDMETVIARLEWMEARQAERHVDNVTRLDRIESEVRRTNGRVTRLEERMKTVFERLKSMLHRGTGASDGNDGDGVTVGRLKWYLACAGGGFAACLWLLHAMGKI